MTKSEDELYNRETVFQGVSEGSWRAKGADRKDEPIRRDDRGVSSSQREKRKEKYFFLSTIVKIDRFAYIQCGINNFLTANFHYTELKP